MQKWIPNLLTLLNLFAGCAGILLLYEGRPDLAMICATTALFADFADGLSARLLNAASPMGTELDSLADIVSFGVFPAFILAYINSAYCSDHTLWSTMPVLLLPLAAAYRLATFNTDTRNRSVFYGLPVPGAAFAVFGFLLMDLTDNAFGAGMLCKLGVLYAIVLLLSVLMNANIRLWSLKGLNEKNGRLVITGLVATFALLVVLFQAAALPIMVAIYVLFGLLNYVLKIY